jgi:DNA-binding transcriptional MerR regulator
MAEYTDKQLELWKKIKKLEIRLGEIKKVLDYCINHHYENSPEFIRCSEEQKAILEQISGIKKEIFVASAPKPQKTNNQKKNKKFYKKNNKNNQKK